MCGCRARDRHRLRCLSVVDTADPHPVDPFAIGCALFNTCRASYGALRCELKELRRLSLRYADRDPFSGDGRAVLKDEARVKEAGPSCRCRPG